MTTDVQLVSHSVVQKICVKALRNAGVSEDSLHIVIDNLVDANLRGIDSHGVMRLPFYIDCLRNGLINPRPTIGVRRSSLAVIQVDGGNGLGQLVAHHAMSEALQLAGVTGIACAGVRASSHCGALSYYLLQAARKGFIGIGFTNAESLQIPFGGTEPYFGTNPIAFSFPAGVSQPIAVDFATSAITFGQIVRAREQKRTLPEGCVLDAAGAPTRDPNAAAHILPASGHKGYGLALAVDVLTGILNGGPYGSHIPRVFTQAVELPMALCHLFIVLHPGFFGGKDMFHSSVDAMIKELHDIASMKGTDGVLVPGEPEAKVYERRLAEGLPISSSLLRELERLSGDSVE